MLGLLGRREVGLPSARVKRNEVIARDLHTSGFVLVYAGIMYYYSLNSLSRF